MFYFGAFDRFLTGPTDLSDDKSMGKLPRVFVNTETENEECYLLVYRAMSATICMLINGKNNKTDMFC